MSAIAKAAGVGKATVSLALRNDPRLRRETCLRIQRIADKLGYRPNPVVSNLMAQLRASQTPNFQANLGLINAAENPALLRDVDTFRLWTEGLIRGSARQGYKMDEFWLHDPKTTPKRLRKILDSRNIRGLVVAGILSNGALDSRFDPIWENIACVAVGLRPSHPKLHVASNDQFSTALHAVGELRKRGYRRPGLVIEKEVDENIDRRFSSGFWAGQNDLAAKNRIPPFPFRREDRVGFRKWLERYRPDSILCLHDQVRDWLRNFGVRVPADIGLAHLDITSGLEGWSGMDQKNELVGSSAVDLVVGQLHRNEKGIPMHPKCVMVESVWVDGSTLRISK
jgi:DNA-binding LacI/PurR family transcriptional regulator